MAVTDYTVAADLQDLDEKIKSMMVVGETNKGGNFKGRVRICKVCGKEGARKTIMDHIESNHIVGVSHTCDICGIVANTSNSLACHKRKHAKTC